MVYGFWGPMLRHAARFSAAARLAFSELARQDLFVIAMAITIVCNIKDSNVMYAFSMKLHPNNVIYPRAGKTALMLLLTGFRGSGSRRVLVRKFGPYTYPESLKSG